MANLEGEEKENKSRTQRKKTASRLNRMENEHKKERNVVNSQEHDYI